jgi:DNA-binding NarL/FixJ family response regulator
MKILIVDDHPLFRAGFHAVLEQSSLEASILSVSTLREAIGLIDTDSDIGLVLLDLHLRDSDGFSALRQIGDRFPTTACIIISGDEHDGIANQSVAAGASGFIPKSFTADEMLAAIEHVLDGNFFVPAVIDTAVPRRNNALTLRQLEVVTMLARGFSNKEIARELDLAERTVKAHVTAVLEALNVKNRTQAVIAAQQQGLLPSVSTYEVARIHG